MVWISQDMGKKLETEESNWKRNTRNRNRTVTPNIQVVLYFYILNNRTKPESNQNRTGTRIYKNINYIYIKHN